jgi:hypothetical protein
MDVCRKEQKIVTLNEISQTQKDKCCVLSLICGTWGQNKMDRKVKGGL